MDSTTNHIRTAAAISGVTDLLYEEFQQLWHRPPPDKGQWPAWHVLAIIVMLVAFGIEHALKALLRKQGCKPSHIRNLRHDLRKLYKELDSHTQTRIQENADVLDPPIKHGGKVTSFSVEAVLNEHRDSFQEWRYHEYRFPGVMVETLIYTLVAMLHTYHDLYGTDDFSGKPQMDVNRPPPEMKAIAKKYLRNILRPRA